MDEVVDRIDVLAVRHLLEVTDGVGLGGHRAFQRLVSLRREAVDADGVEGMHRLGVVALVDFRLGHDEVHLRGPQPRHVPARVQVHGHDVTVVQSQHGSRHAWHSAGIHLFIGVYQFQRGISRLEALHRLRGQGFEVLHVIGEEHVFLALQLRTEQHVVGIAGRVGGSGQHLVVVVHRAVEGKSLACRLFGFVEPLHAQQRQCLDGIGARLAHAHAVHRHGGHPVEVDGLLHVGEDVVVHLLHGHLHRGLRHVLRLEHVGHARVFGRRGGIVCLGKLVHHEVVEIGAQGQRLAAQLVFHRRVARGGVDVREDGVRHLADDAIIRVIFIIAGGQFRQPVL